MIKVSAITCCLINIIFLFFGASITFVIHAFAYEYYFFNHFIRHVFFNLNLNELEVQLMLTCKGCNFSGTAVLI